MYCLFCGQQIPDGSVICPSCGASLNVGGAQQPQQAQQFAQQPQQAQQFVQPQQPQQFAQPQQPQQFAQPQQPQQFAQPQQPQQFAQPQQPQQFAQPQQPQQFAQPQQPQQFAQPQQPQQFAQPQQPQQSAQPQQPQQFAQPQQPQQFVQPQQAQQPVYNAGGASMPKPKKKSKKGLAIGLGCGGAAVAAAAAVTVFVIKPNENPAILRMIKGDVPYAKSVQETYINNFMDMGKEYTGLLTKASKGAGNVIKRQGPGFKSSEGYNKLKDKYDSQRVDLANALYSYTDMADNPDLKNVTLTVSIDVELGDALKAFMRDRFPQYDEYAENIESSINALSGLEIKIAQSGSDDTYKLYVDLSGGGSDIGGIAIELKKSGEIRIGFPGLSDTVITTTIPSYEEMGIGEITSAESTVGLDADKIDALARKITDAYYSCYESADVKYSDAEITFGSEKEKCTVITVTMDNASVGKVFEKVADVIENDSYIDEIIAAYGLDTSSYNAKESFVNTLRSSAETVSKPGEGNIPELKFITENYVNGHNECVGSKFRFVVGDVEYFKLESIDNGKYMDMRLTVNTGGKTEDIHPLLTVSGTHTETSGDLDVVFDSGALNSYKYEAGRKMTVNLNYSDVKKFTAFGQEIRGGTFKIKVSDCSMMAGRLDSSTIDVLKSAEFMLSLAENEGGVKSTIGLSVGSYGSIKLNLSAVPKADIPAVSGSNIIDFNNISSEDGQRLGTELMESLQNKAESNTALKTILMIVPTMKGYISESKVNSADSTASTMKDCFNTFITEMDAKNYGILRTSDTYEFRLDISVPGQITFTTDYPDMILSENALKYDGGSDGSAWLNKFAQYINECYDIKDDSTAWFYVKNGMCIGVAYYKGYADTYFEHPHAYDFENRYYNWSGGMEGMIGENEIIGTNPKLIHDPNWDNNEYLNHLPPTTRKIELSGIYVASDGSGYLVFSGDSIRAVQTSGTYVDGTYSCENDEIVVGFYSKTATYYFWMSDDRETIRIGSDEYKKTDEEPDYSSTVRNGRYKCVEESNLYLEFSGTNSIVLEANGNRAYGTYSIEGNKIYMKLYFDGKNNNIEADFYKSGNSVYIDDAEYRFVS